MAGGWGWGRGVSGGLLVPLCLLLCVAGSFATCPAFATWIRPDGWASIHPVICGGVQCNNLDGFVTVAVAPDAESITVTLQITAGPQSSNIPMFLSAGIYGPASATEDLPPGTAPLVELPTPMPTMGASTWTSTRKLRPADLPRVLEYMREGKAFVSVATDRVPEGELRGQLHAPHCFESELRPMVPLPASFNVNSPYAFANIMISGTLSDYAVLFQLPTDQARALSSAVSAVRITTGGGDVMVQPRAWDSCVAGTFDGRNLDGLQCSDQERHTYASEVNSAGSGHTIFNVGHMAPSNLVQGLAGLITNSTAHVTVKTLRSALDPAVVNEVEGTLQRAVPCRKLLTAHDSLYTMARDYRNDWVTLWSLNEGNPDVRKTLEPRYYAHPLVVLKGETAFGIQRRYGMSETEILKINPSIIDINNLPVGSHVCIVPNWQVTRAGNGQRVCEA